MNLGGGVRSQPKLALREVRAVLAKISFGDWRFRLAKKGGGWTLQVEFDAPDSDTRCVSAQRGRKFYVSPYMSESEIVEAAWLAVIRAVEHEARERFTYEGHRVKSPHFDVRALIYVCRTFDFDARIPAQGTR